MIESSKTTIEPAPVYKVRHTFEIRGFDKYLNCVPGFKLSSAAFGDSPAADPSGLHLVEPKTYGND